MALPGIHREELVTTEDVATRLGVTQRTIKAMVKRGQLEPIAAMGGTMAFRVSEIERYEREHNAPHIKNIKQIAAYYGIDIRRAAAIFRVRHRTLSVTRDPNRGMLYDLSRAIHRHIEAKYKLTPRRRENGEIDFKLDG
jgi:excisionase family DNA binding protein